MAEHLPAGLLGPLADLGKWLEAVPAQAMIVGGVAVSLLSRPRFTQDIDALAILAESEWQRAIEIAARYGILPRIANALEFARESRVLLLVHSATSIDIDVIFGGLAFERNAVMQAQIHEVGGMPVRLPRIEDLLIMKAIAHRPQDMLDVDALLAAHPDADLESVRRWVREFGAAAAMSDLLVDFDKAVLRRSGV
ncbi:MAG: nucleotidyl transferase AbiEii/AbiGii toxin family protein [Steroidobacteraceae bacterium]